MTLFLIFVVSISCFVNRGGGTTIEPPTVSEEITVDDTAEIGFKVLGEDEFLYDPDGEYFEDGVSYLLHEGIEYSRLEDGTFWIWNDGAGWIILPNVDQLIRLRLDGVYRKNR